MASANKTSSKPQINWEDEEEDDNDTGLPPPQHRSLHQNPPPPSWMTRALDGDDSDSLDNSGNFGQQRNANSTNSGPPNNQRYSYPQMLDTSEYPRVRWSESESSLDNENDPMAGTGNRPDYFANNSGCSPIPRAITSSPVDSRPAPPPVGTGTVAGNSGMPRHRTYGMPGLQYSDSDASSGSEEYSDAGQEPTASASQHQNQQPRVIANAHSVSQPQAHQQAQVPAYFSCDSCSGPGFFSRPVPPSLKIPVRPIHMLRNTNDEPPTNNNRVDAAGTDGLGIWEEAPDEPPLTQHGSNNMMSSQRTALSSTTSVGSNFTIVSDPHVSQYVERQQPLTGVSQVEDLSLSDGREELLDSFLTSNPSSTTNRTFGAAPPAAGATFTLNMSSEASEGTGSTLRGQHQQRAVQNSEDPFFLAEVGSLLQLAQKYELHFDVREDEGGAVIFSEQQSASSSGCRRILIMRSQIYQHGQVLEGLHISMYANGQLWREYDLPLVDTWLGLAVVEGVCISFFNSADHS